MGADDAGGGAARDMARDGDFGGYDEAPLDLSDPIDAGVGGGLGGGFGDAEADLAERLEDRPTGDFIDGFLAGVASAVAAMTGAPANSFFFSFDWIDDGASQREAALAAAFRSAPSDIRLEIVPVSPWRSDVERLAARWFGRGASDRAGAALAAEFTEILEAHFSGGPVSVMLVRPSAVPGAPDLAGLLGVEHDHVLFESPDGRLLLEFSRDG